METVILWVLGCVFVFILLLMFLVRLRQFQEDMEYINLELARTIKSRKYWLKKKRRLWLWLLFGRPCE